MTPEVKPVPETGNKALFYTGFALAVVGVAACLTGFIGLVAASKLVAMIAAPNALALGGAISAAIGELTMIIAEPSRSVGHDTAPAAPDLSV